MAKKSISFNLISLHDLEKIPGIGKFKAHALIEHRNNSNFKNISDLVKVEGITEIFLSRLQNKYEFIFESAQGKINLKRPHKQELVENVSEKEDNEMPTPEKKVRPKYDRCLPNTSQCSNSTVDIRLNSRTIPSCDSPGKAVRSRLQSENARPPDGLKDWLGKFHNWSRDERLIALNDLIGLCDMSVVRHMMAKIEPHFQRDFISLLPKELALYVLSFLEPKDISNAART